MKPTEVKYVIWPAVSKVRYYDDIDKITLDFKAEELQDASISIIFNGVLVGILDTDQAIKEVFNK